MARDLIEVDSDDDSSFDSSRSDTERRVSSNTTLTCAILPGFGTSNESKMKNSMIGAGGSAIASPSFYEHRDSPRLDIDRVPKEVHGLDHISGRADDTCQRWDTLRTRRGLTELRTIWSETDLRK